MMHHHEKQHAEEEKHRAEEKQHAEEEKHMRLQNDGMREMLTRIQPHCEQVGCDKPGPHITHTIEA